MQLVLSNNRIIAHGENFLSMGGVVINTVTGAKYENATVAECEGCPSDIDKVGYEYHAGIFVPCAPYGKGNNNGYFMEVCKDCATPRSSGIPIKGGIKLENLDRNSITAYALGGIEKALLWQNANPTFEFRGQTLNLSTASEYDLLLITSKSAEACIMTQGVANMSYIPVEAGNNCTHYIRTITWNGASVTFGTLCSRTVNSTDRFSSASTAQCTPYQIYGVKL